ncbi:MAG: YfdX family protein [Alphaproteobacteria bacterium]
MTTKMKAQTGKLKNTVCAFALLAALSLPYSGAYAANSNAGADKTATQVEQSKQDQTAEKRKQTLSEAIDAIDDTIAALKALDAKNSKLALDNLKKATGKLEIILARDPGLALAPANVSAATYDLLAGLDDVKKVRREVEDLIDDGHLQEARRIMAHLASETVISTSNIPLATYPLAIKDAAKLIDEGKTEEAKVVLQGALNTIVVTERVMPLPVVKAQAFLKQAESLAENKERKPEQSKEMEELLTAAETEIKFAQELGYGQKEDFEHFYDEITEIRKKTSDGKSGMGFFEKIKGFMSSMTESSQSNKTARKE